MSGRNQKPKDRLIAGRRLTALSGGMARVRAWRGRVALAATLAAALTLTASAPSSGKTSRYRDPLQPSAAGSVVPVTVDPSVVQRRIPRGFLGLSIEYWALENYAGKIRARSIRCWRG